MQLPNKRKILIASFAACVLVVVVGYFGYGRYKLMRQASLVKQARHYIAKPDLRRAMLCLQRALKYNGKDVEALRLMAALTEANRSPSALMYRNRVVELMPKSLDDRLALVQTALLLRDFFIATNTLAGVDEAGRKTAAFQNLAGSADASANRLAEAEQHFMEAARLEPKQKAPQLNLAIVRVHSTNAAVQAQARANLKRFADDTGEPLLRCTAFRELIANAIQNKQWDSAISLSGELIRLTNSVFNDRILQLEAMYLAHSPQFGPALAACHAAAATNTVNISEIAGWEIANTTPKEALTFLTSLPTSTRTNQAVAMLTSECYVTIGDWKGLSASLTNQYWREMEFVRHAFASRALLGQGYDASSKAEWQLALKAANNQKIPLVMLLRLASKWQWESQVEEILWTIVGRYSTEKWAFLRLSEILADSGRTRPLLTLYAQELKRNPSNVLAKNNVAMMGLLLDAQELKPHELAREVYQSAPTNSAFASTYAYSLHLQGKDSEALAVLEKLTPAQLAAPGIAGYYALVLKASGNGAKARPYFDLTTKAKLLPEEQKVFERAKSDVSQVAPKARSPSGTELSREGP